MTFELMRWNWPNTAAILALAVLPIVASVAGRHSVEAKASIEPAAICLPAAECTSVAIAALPELLLE